MYATHTLKSRYWLIPWDSYFGLVINHCLHLIITAFVIIFSPRIASPPTCFASFGKIPASVDATEGGTVDTEIRRFLKVLSEPATFRINNNNSIQRWAKARKRERERGEEKRKRAGYNLAASEGWGQLLRPDTNYTSFLCHFNIATRH